MKVPSLPGRLLLVLAIAVGSMPACSSAPQPAEQDITLGFLEWEGRHDILRQWLQVMGVAVSPVVGMAAAGTLGYYQLPEGERGRAGFFSRPRFWVTLWFIAGFLFFKDTLLTFLGPLKSPLDALAILLQHAGGLLGAGFAMTLLFGNNPAGADLALLAGNVLLSLVTLLVYFAVAVTFGTFDALILINPIPLVDTALTGVRTAVVTLFFAASYVHPALGLLAASPIILLSLWMARKAIRFTSLGLTFAGDLILRRWRTMDPQAEDPVLVFATSAFTGGRSNLRGFLCRQPDGSLEFRYRPFRIGPTRSLPVTSPQLARSQVGRATFAPVLIGPGIDRSALLALFRLPPRYRGHEQALAGHLGICEVTDISLGRGLRNLLRGSAVRGLAIAD